MHWVNRAGLVGIGCLLVTLLGTPALAQPSFDTTYQTIDFSGEWSELAYEGAFQYEAAGRCAVQSGAMFITMNVPIEAGSESS